MTRMRLVGAAAAAVTVLAMGEMALRADEFTKKDEERWQKEYMSVVQKGRELWTSDGTAVGTVLLKDLAWGNSSPNDLVAMGGALYFSAPGPTGGYGRNCHRSLTGSRASASGRRPRLPPHVRRTRRLPR